MVTEEVVRGNDEGLALGYESAVRSYDIALKRVDAWDANLDRLLAWASPITLALLAKTITVEIAQRNQSECLRAWVWALIIFAGVAAITAVFNAIKGKSDGDGIVIDGPEGLLKNWIDLPARDFHFWSICFAADHFEKNKKFVDKKVERSTHSTFFFATSAVLASIAWVLASL